MGAIFKESCLLIVGPGNKLKNKGANVECLLATSPGLSLGLSEALWPGADSRLCEAPSHFPPCLFIRACVWALVLQHGRAEGPRNASLFMLIRQKGKGVNIM